MNLITARKWVVRMVLAALLAGAPVAASSLPVGAAEFVGACNMRNAFHSENPAVPAGGGMARAMSTDNPNGNAGMFNALEVSGCT